MGTNYYLRRTFCDHCGGRLGHLEQDTDNMIHLGKASGGWKFTFAGSDLVKNYAQWLSQMTPQFMIIDEYREEFEMAQFIEIVFRLQQNPTQEVFEGFWLDPNGYYFCGYQGFC